MVEDRAPQVQLFFENESNSTIDRIVDNDDEYIRIVVQDEDDLVNAYLGDVEIDWPGYGLQVLSVEGFVNEGEIQMRLQPPLGLLEAGEVNVLVVL